MEHHGQGGPELSPAQQTQRHSNQNPAPDLSRSVDRGLTIRALKEQGVSKRSARRSACVSTGRFTHVPRSPDSGASCTRGWAQRSQVQTATLVDTEADRAISFTAVDRRESVEVAAREFGLYPLTS